MNLIETTQGITITELSKRLNVSRPTIYLHLNTLEKKGFIERVKDSAKKGSPVTIIPKQKKIEKSRKTELLEFLNVVEKAKQGVNYSNDLLEKTNVSLSSPIFLEAMMRGFIVHKIHLTKEGELFIKENGGKKD